ncbi:16510_t:CDS:2, partial [Racocetra persica]
ASTTENAKDDHIATQLQQKYNEENNDYILAMNNFSFEEIPEGFSSKPTDKNIAFADNNSHFQENQFVPQQFPQQKYTTNKINLSGRIPGVFKILLLGGTGTGKSTIINIMTNYFLGGTPTKYYKVTEN